MRELKEARAQLAATADTETRLRTELEARTRELQESVDYQTATSDVLNVISRSPSNIQPVLDAIAETAQRLCKSEHVFIMRLKDGLYHLAAARNATPEQVEYLRANPFGPDRGSVTGRVALERRTIHIADVLNDSEYTKNESGHRGFRTTLGVPLLREGMAIGVIVLTRSIAQPFADKQIDLVTTFANQAVIAIENVRLFEEVQARTAELQESLEYQTATSDVLNVISRSPNDLQPVLDAIVETAHDLCQARYTIFFRLGPDGLYHLAASKNADEVRSLDWLRSHPIAKGGGTATGLAALEQRTVHFPDALADPRATDFARQQQSRARTQLAVPLMRAGVVIGVIFLARTEVKPFTERQVNLVTTFADQAVIAINNVGLFEEVQARTAELQEALEYQTATSEVLNVISRAPSQLLPVFEAIVATAARLCEAEYTLLYRLVDGKYHVAAANNVDAEFIRYAIEHPLPPGRGSLTGRTALEGRTMHVPDVLADPEYKVLERQKVGRYRTVLGVPLLRDGVAIGVIAMMRSIVKPFTEKQIDLVATFADQAVIAIENVRLFEEVQARTRELQESLDYQTATSDVLNVISRSPSELQPVLDVIVQTAARLCEAEYAFIAKAHNGECHLAAANNMALGHIQFFSHNPAPINRDTVTGRVALDKRTIHVSDVLSDPEFKRLDWQEVGKQRTVLGVPLLCEGALLGVIILARTEVRPFTERQVELVSTFADQAVIAIENARLFNEVQARTAELTEALEQQIATADVLTVISNSLSDTQPVFDAIVQSGLRLFAGAAISIALPEGDQVQAVAVAESDPTRAEAWWRRFPFPLTREYMHSAAILDRKMVDIPDVRDAPPEFEVGARNFLGSGYRAVTIMPMMRGESAIGALSVVRVAPGPLAEKELATLKTFANQAVIAIENTRLLNELRARTEDLARSVNELQALGEVSHAVNSTLDLETVLSTIVSKAVQLSSTDAGAIYVFSNLRQKFRLRATYGMSEAMIADIGRQSIGLGESYIGDAARRGEAIQVADLAAEPTSPMRDLVVGAGYRGLLAVPLLRPGRIIGALVVRRKEPGLFPKSTIDLLQTFAAQSVLAIQNARLFEDVEGRTRELAKSLEELRATQDRLIQTEKLASLGQLTAGIAHEIKNPLNFVNNFAALSIELIDELKDALQSATTADHATEQVAEITGLLASNLEKVVQHGKRADSIVKNMLLHSRAGAGERRVSDINALVEESLSLAYHGVRAEKQGFNITIEKSLDPAAGEVDLYPQEMTRVLLNLISNGFYATMKRKHGDGVGYEPTLSATTRSLGESVEIKIRDNGTGIAPEVKEKMFNPFFTTKPAGEGTGLGLSLSHDIIVKQHAGSIEVDTQPGEFTEFRIVLPRSAGSLG
jgi:GAF domain-containing protein